MVVMKEGACEVKVGGFGGGGIFLKMAPISTNSPNYKIIS